jgi:S-adenosylmethionine:tRNA ribosyltransferase-isomerase
MVDLPGLLAPGDLLVFNDTRVIAARLFGRKASGGAIEVLVERILDAQRMAAKIRASKPPQADSTIGIGDFSLRVRARHGELYTLALDNGQVDALLAAHGHVPLPPYIRRADNATDRDRYQTLWARYDGAVAAPTAGLHFDAALLDTLRARGVAFGTVTLHVGSGTYQRLRAGDVRQQRLHAERVNVSAALCTQIARTRAAGGRVVAVGTTVVRSLEAAARQPGAVGRPRPFSGETTLFVKPGDAFYAIDALLTNFHEPQSSLLMLVCAFAGREAVLAAYAHARAAHYRFLSYGDAMLIS